MSNFIERNLLDKAGERGTKLGRLLEDLGRERARDERLEAERNEEQEPKPAPRGLPAGFGFRRRLNH
jgi:hypothetical protein